MDGAKFTLVMNGKLQNTRNETNPILSAILLFVATLAQRDAKGLSDHPCVDESAVVLPSLDHLRIEATKNDTLVEYSRRRTGRATSTLFLDRATRGATYLLPALLAHASRRRSHVQAPCSQDGDLSVSYSMV